MSIRPYIYRHRAFAKPPERVTVPSLLIEIEDLRKTFGGRVVLDGVSLRIDRGETVVISGPSGSGKTTLLRCLNGLERADAGTVRVDGHALGANGPDQARSLMAIRRRVGFVFQQWNLFANRTVLHNVMEAPIHVGGVARATASRAAISLLERVGIAHRADAYPDQLSGGEQQRAAIARALAMEPEVLLLDEPTSALDGARVDDLLRLLRDLGAGPEVAGVPRARRLTMIAVSHDARVSAGLGGRLLTLAGGRITHDSDASGRGRT